MEHGGVAVEERADLVVVGARDQRAHVDVVGRPSGAERGDGLDQPLDEVVVRTLLDEDATAGAAVLAGVVEHRAGRGRRGGVDIRVGEHDRRRLAAELERDALHGVRGTGEDGPADPRRAGEAHLADEWIGGERSPPCDGVGGVRIRCRRRIKEPILS